MNSSKVKNLIIALLSCIIIMTSYNTITNDVRVDGMTHPVENCEELIATYEELVINYKKKDALQEKRVAAYQEIVDLLKGELGIE